MQFWRLLLCTLCTVFIINAAGCASRGRGYYHRVSKGETLYRIAKAYQVSMDEVARANNMRNKGYIRSGQYLLIPGRQRASKVDPPPDNAKRKNTWQKRVTGRLKATNLSGRFVWPLSNQFKKVINPFGKVGKKKNNGIDISASFGAAVLAIAGGKVVYAGEKVEGFGKTVIIRHKEDIFSIYSFLSKFSVKVDDVVIQGKVIGHVGLPGRPIAGLTGAALHFELRERTIPVNPENLLP